MRTTCFGEFLSADGSSSSTPKLIDVGGVDGDASAGGLMGHVNKLSHVFTLSHVAEMLGED